ncbi:hypothetical protein [Aliikangiella sp. IMCC44632]
MNPKSITLSNFKSIGLEPETIALDGIKLPIDKTSTHTALQALSFFAARAGGVKLALEEFKRLKNPALSNLQPEQPMMLKVEVESDSISHDELSNNGLDLSRIPHFILQGPLYFTFKFNSHNTQVYIQAFDFGVANQSLFSCQQELVKSKTDLAFLLGDDPTPAYEYWKPDLTINYSLLAPNYQPERQNYTLSHYGNRRTPVLLLPYTKYVTPRSAGDNVPKLDLDPDDRAIGASLEYLIERYYQLCHSLQSSEFEETVGVKPSEPSELTYSPYQPFQGPTFKDK